jgi:hypothetical protein
MNATMTAPRCLVTAIDADLRFRPTSRSKDNGFVRLPTRFARNPIYSVLGKQRWRARGGGSGGSLSTSSAAPVPSFGAAGVQDHPTTQQESSLMRKGKAVGVDADLEVRIAQIKQMTLDQIGAFQSRILTDITTGRIAPREASAIDRALRKRLKAIEQQLRS